MIPLDSLRPISPFLWEIPEQGAMKVPGRIYASESLLSDALRDRALEQVKNVACLPGIVGASLAMPDLHWGYGFPIGGVAAFDAEKGVISPGGVGYDINCGVRLMRAEIGRDEILARLPELVKRIFKAVPGGVGSQGAIALTERELRRVAIQGAGWAFEKGYGSEGELSLIEENGCLEGADPGMPGSRAVERGALQLGTLGSGNHFIEIGFVDEVCDKAAAGVMGLYEGGVTMCIHTGSRGFGHQICEDHLRVMDRAGRKYGIEVPDRQLSCAPVNSPEGREYYAAMVCAVNYAFCNRQIVAHLVREAMKEIFGTGLRISTVYEVAHNIAKMETHVVEGRKRRLCVHRKGATRALGPGSSQVPWAYRAVGQPVLIPGDMGRASFVLAGTAAAEEQTFASTCHGAGRRLSRKAAIAGARGRSIIRELAAKGVLVMAAGKETLAEEMPEAYKDVTEVVAAVAGAGISRKVAKIRPLACIKG